MYIFFFMKCKRGRKQWCIRTFQLGCHLNSTALLNSKILLIEIKKSHYTKNNEIKATKIGSTRWNIKHQTTFMSNVQVDEVASWKVLVDIWPASECFMALRDEDVIYSPSSSSSTTSSQEVGVVFPVYPSDTCTKLNNIKRSRL